MQYYTRVTNNYNNKKTWILSALWIVCWINFFLIPIATSCAEVEGGPGNVVIENINTNQETNDNRNNVDLKLCLGTQSKKNGSNGGDNGNGTNNRLNIFNVTKQCQAVPDTDQQHFECEAIVRRSRPGRSGQIPQTVNFYDRTENYILSGLIHAQSSPNTIPLEFINQDEIKLSIDVATYLGQVGDQVSLTYSIDMTALETDRYCDFIQLLEDDNNDSELTTRACFNYVNNGTIVPRYEISKACNDHISNTSTNCTILVFDRGTVPLESEIPLLIVDQVQGFSVDIIEDNILISPESVLLDITAILEEDRIEISLNRSALSILGGFLLDYTIDTTSLEDGVYHNTVSVPEFSDQLDIRSLFFVNRENTTYYCNVTTQVDVPQPWYSGDIHDINTTMHFEGRANLGNPFVISIAIFGTDSEPSTNYPNIDFEYNDFSCLQEVCTNGSDEFTGFICVFGDCVLSENYRENISLDVSLLTTNISLKILDPTLHEVSPEVSFVYEPNAFCGENRLHDVETFSVVGEVSTSDHIKKHKTQKPRDITRKRVVDLQHQYMQALKDNRLDSKQSHSFRK